MTTFPFFTQKISKTFSTLIIIRNYTSIQNSREPNLNFHNRHHFNLSTLFNIMQQPQSGKSVRFRGGIIDPISHPDIKFPWYTWQQRPSLPLWPKSQNFGQKYGAFFSAFFSLFSANTIHDLICQVFFRIQMVKASDLIKGIGICIIFLLIQKEKIIDDFWN